MNKAAGGEIARAPDAAQRAVLHGVVRCRAGVPVTVPKSEPGSRFCEAALREVLRAASRPGQVTKKGGCRFRQPPLVCLRKVASPRERSDTRELPRSRCAHAGYDISASRTGTSGGLWPCRTSCARPRGCRG